MLEVRLIGTFAIQCDGQPITISSRLAQSLFAYLILTAGTVHRREKLAGMFWPDLPEAKARAYLRNELWRIRKALPSHESMLSDSLGITFDPAIEYWLDARLLEDLKDNTSADQLIEVFSTCEGELLPGFYDEWIVLEREHLRTIYEQNMARLLEILAGENRWQEIPAWAERWISHGQAPESAYRYMMIAYDALGDRAKVMSTYQRCVQALRELDLESSEQTRLLAFKRPVRLNLPIPLTSFIGREQELKEIAHLLSKSRLVTLTGSGGVGKTRLAIQVVADVMDKFPDGIWFLELAPLNDPSLVPNTLANLLGLRESEDSKISLSDLLINYLRSRSALVIFDNCEHLIGACTQLVHALLTACESLSILATSREALQAAGEIPYRVPSLELPKPEIEWTVADLLRIESVRLFGQRAAIVSRGFASGPQNALAIAQICQRLDGIPLAIELAAARTNLLTVDQILKRLDDRFNLLKGGLRTALPRHQTLRAMIEWSYDLLSEQERLLFRRLAVFAGGWTLEAAELGCSGEGLEPSEVLDLLSQLVNKSLVLTETVQAEMRYRCLETIRQFARELLAVSDEVVQLQERHLTYFLNKAEQIEPFLIGSKQSTWMEYLELELDNIRLALDWSISNQRGERALRLFGALGWFWMIHCHYQEGIRWFKRAWELRSDAAKPIQAKALGHVAQLFWLHEGIPAARSILRESINLYHEIGDMKGMSNRLLSLGVVEENDGNEADARLLYEETLRIGRMVDNRPAIARALFNLAALLGREGDFASASEYYEESLAICRELDDRHLMTMLLMAMGETALERRDFSKAQQYYREALIHSLDLKNKWATALSLLRYSRILYAKTLYPQSANLQGFATRLLNEIGSRIGEEYQEFLRETTKSLKLAMGEASYHQEFEVGRTLTLEKAVEIALESARVSGED